MNMEEIKLEEQLIKEIRAIRISVLNNQVEKALKNPKSCKLYQINQKTFLLQKEIEKELKIKEEIKQSIDTCEDSLVEYHNVITFNQHKHEKYINSTKQLNESYIKTIEKETRSFPNSGENFLLKAEVQNLIKQRNELLEQISEIENYYKFQEEKEENELKHYIKYLNDQLNLIKNY
jgi:hypothetical protein